MTHKEYCSLCKKEYDTNIEYLEYANQICDKCYLPMWVILENEL